MENKRNFPMMDLEAQSTDEQLEFLPAKEIRAYQSVSESMSSSNIKHDLQIDVQKFQPVWMTKQGIDTVRSLNNPDITIIDNAYIASCLFTPKPRRIFHIDTNIESDRPILDEPPIYYKACKHYTSAETDFFLYYSKLE